MLAGTAIGFGTMNAANAAIVQDTSTVGSSATTGFDLSVSGTSDRVVVVGIAGENAAAGTNTVSSVTFDGASMTLADKASYGSGAYNEASLWYLFLDDSVAAGDYTVNVTENYSISEFVYVARVLSGAAATAPTTSTKTSENTVLSTMISGMSAGDYVMDILARNNTLSGSNLIGTGGDRLSADGSGTHLGAGMAFGRTYDGPSLITWSWTDGSQRTAHVVAAFESAPVPEPATAGLLLAGGLVALSGRRRRLA